MCDLRSLGGGRVARRGSYPICISSGNTLRRSYPSRVPDRTRLDRSYPTKTSTLVLKEMVLVCVREWVCVYPTQPRTWQVLNKIESLETKMHT